MYGFLCEPKFPNSYTQAAVLFPSVVLRSQQLNNKPPTQKNCHHRTGGREGWLRYHLRCTFERAICQLAIALSKNFCQQVSLSVLVYNEETKDCRHAELYMKAFYYFHAIFFFNTPLRHLQEIWQSSTKNKNTTVGPLTLTLWQSSPFLPVTAFGSFFFLYQFAKQIAWVWLCHRFISLDVLGHTQQQSSVSGLRLIKEMVQLVRQKKTKWRNDSLHQKDPSCLTHHVAVLPVSKCVSPDDSDSPQQASRRLNWQILLRYRMAPIHFNVARDVGGGGLWGLKPVLKTSLSLSL